MKRSLTGLFPLLFGISYTPALLAKPEVSVCVEVTLRAPPTTENKNAQKKDATSASAAEKAEPASGATKDAPNKASPSPSEGATPPSVSNGPLPALAQWPESESTESSAVSAETAANLASEVDPENSRDARVASGAHLPLGQTPTLYLKRLMDHFITHEPGFVASAQCSERVEVELYPLKVGWTAFARYSGTGREERVDQLLPTELSQFAERSVLALLRDVPISATVSRDNVLWADSLKSSQRIRGRGHLALGVGTRLRAGRFNTLNASREEVAPEYRLFTPMALTLGYRGQFDEYGVEAGTELDIGTGVTGVRHNPTGGNIDYGGSFGVALHVLRYTRPRALTSPYFGAGATFALHWFQAIRAEGTRNASPRSALYGGGLDVDLVGGYEFMRASAISFYLQGELTLPAYAVRTENEDGRINSWFPGAALRLGANFF